jgi:hypothetical protein
MTQSRARFTNLKESKVINLIEKSLKKDMKRNKTELLDKFR